MWNGALRRRYQKGSSFGLADDAPPPATVAGEVAQWTESRWRLLTVAEREKGRLTYDLAYERVGESGNSLPCPDAWLLAQRPDGHRLLLVQCAD